MTTVEKKTSLPQDQPSATTAGNPNKVQDAKPENIELVIKEKQTKREINLKKKEEELIKGYKLVPGDYRVLIRILEANDLFPKIEEGGMIKDLLKAHNNKEGSANPYVVIELLDKTKKTTIKKKTLNPIFNEQFYFEFKDLIMSQLEEASIIFRVMDYNLPPYSDTLIGTFEVDLTTIYFSPNHQIPQASLLLYDPEDRAAATSGLLKVNLEVLGPKDEPNVQNAITSNKPETNKERIMKPAALKPIGHNVEINLFRAEHLPILDFSTEGIDAFAVVKYAGVTKATKIITSFNPEWNQNIRLGTMLPNQSKAVNVEIWDYDLLNKNDLVGTFKVDFKSFQDKYLAPRWVNLYGPPVSATQEDIAETMRLYGYDIGSHYMGRVLYSIGSYNDKEPSTKITNLNFSFPKNPEPISPERTYVLQVDLYEAQELPERENCIITICIGPYLIKSKPKKIENGRCFIYERFDDKKLVLPANIEEVPDVFIYFSDKDKEDRRHSFARFKAKDFMPPKVAKLESIKLREDRSLNLVTDDEFPGYLFARIGLYNTAPPPRPEFKNKGIQLKEYQLRVMVHVGRNLPPADQDGASDPFVVVRAGGKSARTKVMRRTLNPGWFESLKLDIKIPEFGKSEVPEGISLLVYDSDSHNDEDYDEKELLGRAWMRIENVKRMYKPQNGAPIPVIYQKPRWKNIVYDALEQIQGKILVSYILIPKEQTELIHFHPEIKPDVVDHKVHLFLIGIRDINMDELGFWKPLQVAVNFDVSGDGKVAAEGEKHLIVNNGATVNKYVDFDIGVPFSKELTPLLDVHLNGFRMGMKSSQMLGYASIDLKGALENFYKINNPSETCGSQHAIKTVLEIEEDGADYPSKKKIKTETDIKVKTQTQITDPKKQAKSQTDLNKQGKSQTNLNSKKESVVVSQPDQNVPGDEEEKVEESLQDIQLEVKEEKEGVEGAEGERGEGQGAEGQAGQRQGGEKPPIFQKEPSAQPQQQMTQVGSQKRIESQKVLKVGGDTQRLETDERGALLNPQEKLERENQEFLHKLGGKLFRKIDDDNKDVDTFRIQKEDNFDFTQIYNDYLDIEKVDRVNVPDPTKGNVEILKNRGLVVPKKSGAGKLMDLIFGKDEVIEYNGYDTDENEDLSVIPAWIDKRGTVNDELEDVIGPNLEIQTFPIKRGRTRGRASFFGDKEPAGISTIANLKAIFLEGDTQATQAKRDNYLKLMEPKKYACRVYVLEGVNITKPNNPRELPDTYLVLKIGKEVKNDQRNSLRLQNSRPEYYNRYDFLVDIPSASSLEIEVWHHNKLLADEFLGKTVIDLENRHFHPEWRSQKYATRPIEYRSLLNEDAKGTYGKLSLWVDLDPVEEKAKIFEIAPQEKVECELRVIVWEAKNFVHRNTATQASDLFVRGYIGGRNGEAQETDIHWRARAKASFNWRFKYKMTLPFSRDSLGEDRFKLELWDKDVLASDASLGEADIYLNTHKMLDKVYKRRKGCKLMLKYLNKDKKEIKTDQIWYDVFGKETDANGKKISTGKVLVSFELIPLVEAEKKKNGLGRDAPNNFPNLGEPVGRFSFDIFSPLQTLKELIGPSAYRKLCLCLCCLIVLTIGIAFGYFILTSALGAAIAK